MVGEEMKQRTWMFLVGLLLILGTSAVSSANYLNEPAEQAPKVVKKIWPGYPALAAARRISGTVLVDVQVDQTGKVTEATPLTGHKLLRDAAKKAAVLWQFNETSKDVPMRTVRLTFIFHKVSYVPPK